MINIFKSNKEKEQFINEFKDPFNSRHIDKIEFTIKKGFFGKKKLEYSALIRFEVKNTSGYHTIDAKDFKDLILKTEYFIKSL